MASKTQQAIDLMAANPDMTAYRAAKEVGVSLSAVYTTIGRKRKQADRQRCECCGQLLPVKPIKKG